MLLGLFLSSCLQTSTAEDLADYPPRWDNLHLSNDRCHSLSGTYEYFGEEGRATKYVKTPRLDLLGFLKSIATSDVISVRIEHEPERESAIVTVNQKESPSRQVKLSVICRDGWSEVRKQSNSANGESGSIVSVERSRLTKSSNGALVVHFQYSVEVRHFFNSKTHTGTDWYRFAPYSSIN